MPSPNSNKQASYRLATRPQAEVVHHQRMVGWFDPIELIRMAVRSLLGTLFGQYLDRRETQAALHPSTLGPGAHTATTAGTCDHDYSDKNELWMDYVADLGDGWDATYTIAWLLAQPTLQLAGPKGTIETQRGDILVMGGDQVYPSATREAYQYRTVDPYRCALPWVADGPRPHLYAIPGNHDWYDGLTSFLRLFCQRRSIGGWKTCQARSYFALKLPHRWWLFAVDIQLESDLDWPQIEYFRTMLDQVSTGDKIILCTAESTWVDQGDPRAAASSEHTTPGLQAHHNLSVLEDLIRQKHGDIAITLAGDLHHYSHYANTSGDRHKFTAGGGGAYTLGTHQLPESIDLFEGAHTKESYQRSDTAYPSPSDSRRMRWRALALVFYNWQFAVLVGGYYLFYSWVLQSASKVPNAHLGHKSLFEVFAGLDVWHSTVWRDVAHAWYWTLAHSPSSVVFAMLPLALVLYVLRTPDAPKWWERLLWGGGHAAAHMLLALGLMVVFAKLNISMLGGALGLSAGQASDSWWQVLLFIAEMLVAGGLLGGTLVGVYLVLGNALARLNCDHVFSVQRGTGYKNFLRMHITADKLTVYAVGVRSAIAQWTLNAQAKPVPGGAGPKVFEFEIDREAPSPWFHPTHTAPSTTLLQTVVLHNQQKKQEEVPHGA
jgi:hypothetical protein